MKKDMFCPVCEFTPLQVSNRQNIEIDYCPSCRGVWLDKGELDKIIERTYAEVHQPVGGAQHPAPPEYRDRPPAYHDPRNDARHDPRQDYRRRDDDDDDDDGRYDPRRSAKRKRREGFLDNIFDIFD